jgi:hypothetical protein
MTNFNTVVLFDVENLLGEPSRWKQAATELSFNDIIAQLRRDDSGLIGDFAVSRAYANWGLQFMGALRREMTENGVEPRQIFAYDAAAKRNAADIELVIDALDLAYSRPGVSTFVLVTRDGGFSSLGRKLHELGKAVVVCADAQCSKALRAVADSFVELPAPEEGLLVVDTPRDTGEVLKAIDLGKEGERALDQARKAAIREIDALARREQARLDGEGILLQSVGQVFASEVPSLAVARSAYPGLRSSSSGRSTTRRTASSPSPPRPTDLGIDSGCVRATWPTLCCRRSSGARRASPIASISTGCSRAKASRSCACPRPMRRRRSCARWRRAMSRTRRSRRSSAAPPKTLTGSVSTADVKFTVLALAQTDVMVGEPANMPMSDRRYTLVGGTRTFGQLRGAPEHAARQARKARRDRRLSPAATRVEVAIVLHHRAPAARVAAAPAHRGCPARRCRRPATARRSR